MAFDGLKRIFRIGSRSPQHREDAEYDTIDSEIESLEKEIQESLDYANSRRPTPNVDAPKGPDMPENFAQGGGVARAEKIKPA